MILGELCLKSNTKRANRPGVATNSTVLDLFSVPLRGISRVEVCRERLQAPCCFGEIMLGRGRSDQQFPGQRHPYAPPGLVVRALLSALP